MKIKFIIIIYFIPVIIYGQDVLNDYVRYGLENNLALKQKLSGYEKSIEALREARALFYPNISFNARYTISEGGRIIDFPVGDLLNPVYATLNSLTSSNIFPMIENQEIRFLRPTEHETKIRIAQTLFNSDIYYNSRIKKELSVVEEMDVEQYRRELTAEIKKAYYNAAMTDALLLMLNDSRKLLVENVRVNRKLIGNDKVTPDYLYRSEAELDKFDQELQNAEKNNKIACAYFNFLLNRSLRDSIIIRIPSDFPVLAQLTGEYTRAALENREELRKLENYEKISDLQIKMNQSGRLPDLFFVADYGFQGEEYVFNRDQDYMQASAVLTWNLFEGFRNKSKIKQALLEKEMAENQLEEARKQIELQVMSALDELSAAEKGILAAQSRLKNSRESYRIVERKYGEGQITLIEFIDARTTLTRAEENLIISKFQYLSAFAEFEKVAVINKIK
ncbi:MAG: TolC family protein [Bacteroidales bacterium]|nr:TolC family protein [Bacteroidales bacterium]